MIGDNLRDIYHQTKWALVLRGVLSIIVGVFIISRPMESVAAFALIIALWALFDGVVNIVRSFNLRGVVSHWWVLLVSGIISVNKARVAGIDRDQTKTGDDRRIRYAHERWPFSSGSSCCEPDSRRLA